jgi:hypothetical protein
VTHLKGLESTWSQADFHCLSTPYQGIKLVLVLTEMTLMRLVVLIVEGVDDRFGIGTKQAWGTVM